MITDTDSYTDVVELCALLQCLGYAVKSLDSSDANISQDGGVKTVVINCQSSGLHVVLESGAAPCSCPARNHDSSVWQVEAVSGGKQHDKECGSKVLGTLPKVFKERITKDLREMVLCIKRQNESIVETDGQDASKTSAINKSASLIELKTTPEKMHLKLKADTPTRYRSLDTLTSSAASALPPPGALAVKQLVTQCSVDDDHDACKRSMCRRQSTYTVASTPGSVRRRNKTSSPIHASQSNSLLDNLISAEKTAEELRNRLALVIREYAEEERQDSSMSSLVLDVSKISLIKGNEPKSQFASSPNLSGLNTLHEDLVNKIKLNRYESASTSNLSQNKLGLKDSVSKLSKLRRRLSPNIFKSKKDSPGNVKGSEVKTLSRPRIVTPVRLPKSASEASPSLSSSKKKYSHIKSTIPRPSYKKE